MNKQKDEMLKGVALFSDLTPDYLKLLADSCVESSWQAGETIIEQGDQGIGLMVIVAGSVKVLKKRATGADLDVATMGPGEFFGEITVLDSAPRTASVVATEDTECLVLSSWVFKAAMETHPEIALQVLPVVVRRYRSTNDKLLALQDENASSATD